MGPPAMTFLGLASDLVGRPSPAAFGGSSTVAGIPSPPALPSRVAAGGQAPGMPQELELGSSPDEPAVSDVAARDVPEPGEVLKAGVGFDASQVIPPIDGLRQWAVRVTAAASAWVGSWFGGGPRSAASRREAGTAAPDVDRVPSRAAPDHAAKLDRAKSGDEASWWTKFLSMAIVVLSGALAARMSRPFTRWWMARKRVRARGRRGAPTEER